MIGMAPGIVTNGGANFGGNDIQVSQKFLDGFFLKVGKGGDGLVQVVDVGGVMFVVMQGHGLSIDVGFQGVGRVGEGRKGKRSG